MSTINETVNASLQAAGLGQYQQSATPVVQALIDREQRIFIGIVEAGVNLGAQRQQVVTALAGLGMAVPPGMDPRASAVNPMQAVPNQEFVPGEAATLEEDTLLARVERLEDFARRNGYNG